MITNNNNKLKKGIILLPFFVLLIILSSCSIYTDFSLVIDDETITDDTEIYIDATSDEILECQIVYDTSFYNTLSQYTVAMVEKSDMDFDYTVNDNDECLSTCDDYTSLFDIEEDGTNFTIDLSITMEDLLTSYWEQANDDVDVDLDGEYLILDYFDMVVTSFDSSNSITISFTHEAIDVESITLDPSYVL